MKKMINCCLCNRPIKDIDSNNAEPLEEGRCCDICNLTKVLPERIRRIREE